MDDDDGDGAHDAFATGRLWKASSLFDDPAMYNSSLFAPIELDGKHCPNSRVRSG